MTRDRSNDPPAPTSAGRKSKPKAARKPKGKGRGGPRRGYSWRTAENGNTLAMSHGTRSARAVSAATQAVLVELLEVRPWLTQFPEEARAAARAEAVARMLFDHLERVGIADEDDVLRESVLREARRWARFASERVEAMALTPKSALQVRGVLNHEQERRELLDRIANFDSDPRFAQLQAARADGLEALRREEEKHGDR